MLVAAVDTSTPAMTVGVVRVLEPHEMVAALEAASGEGSGPISVVDAVLAQRTVTDSFGHAEHLTPLVTDALSASGYTMRDLAAVVVGVGPGPFTGLRVGMASAAAMGDALDIPVHGVPSHDAMARLATGDGEFLVVTDARRKEVYVSGYTGFAEPTVGPTVVAPADLAAWIEAEGITPQSMTGPATGLVAEHVSLPVREAAGPLSGALVACAAQALVTSAVPGPLVPLYLRRPDATAPSGPKPVLPAATASKS